MDVQSDTPQQHSAMLGPNNKLILCNNSTEGSGELLFKEVNLRPEYDNQFVRNLVNEMSCVFIANQRSPDCPMTVEEVLHYSRSYRAVIKESMQHVQRALMTEDAASADLLDDLMRTLVVSESAWNLMEIIFFQEPQGGELALQLLKWLSIHIDDCRVMMEEVMKEDPVHHHHNYWPAVYGCLLQGKTEGVMELLVASNNTSKSCRVLMSVLSKMPVYQAAGMAVNEYEGKWRMWREELKQMLSQGVFADDDKMAQMAKILSGDLDSILSAVEELSAPWYSYLMAAIFYTQPYAKFHQVQGSIEGAVHRCGGIKSFDTHDSLIYHILRRNLVELMKCCSEEFSSWWFAAHLADVFHQANLLQEKNSLDTTMRDSLLLEYGGSLMQDHRLWNVGIHYLLQCPKYGRYHLQEYLARLPLASTRQALKVLSVCETHGFTQQASSICRVMARREMREDRLGSALTWCRHGKDGNMATIVAEKFLDQYRESVMLPSVDVLDALGPTMLLMSKKLLFLVKLREFHQLVDTGEEKEACSLLVALIKSRTAPARYWFLLILELLPMLESSKVLFTPDEIYDLMNAVTELKQSKSEEMMNELEVSRIQTLHLSLTRCLAKVTLSDSNALVAISCDV
ncbi:NUP85 [Bugula neritina]|uniref:Nuclear pore complex protein Nup85 n=1 Tax=Bugula neritina TaxID=10212 RepID=A0A7J7JK39_BUGNE|nr:NUP85 [Bugula neritina]